MEHQLSDISYRALELLCRKQAAISGTPGTRKALEHMALEYKRLADREERQVPEADARK